MTAHFSTSAASSSPNEDGAAPAPQFPVEARGLSKRYGVGPTERYALRGVDARLEGSKLTALVGPSGSGKSTLLHLLSGLDVPDEGEVVMLGSPLSERSESELAKLRASRMGFVLQRDNLIPSLNLAENVAAPMMLAGEPRGRAHERAVEVLGLVGLDDRSRAFPSEVSGGEAQRAAIARAVAGTPAVIFADEPTGELDSANGRLVMDLLSELTREIGVATLIVTHDAAIAAAADVTLRLQDGRLVDG
jgi:ABC-type lipoprotein export system ATPase subunit